MNSRILRSIWKLNSLRIVSPSNPIASRCYAIPVKLQSRALTKSQVVNLSSVPKAELKEKASNFEHAMKKLQTDFAAHGNVHPTNFQKLLKSLEPGSQISSEQSVFLLEACADLMPSLSSSERMELFEKLWEHLKANDQLKKAHYLALLKVYAANGVKIGNFHEFLEQSGTVDDRQVYEKVIVYACELGDINLATEILAEMKTNNFPLTETVFNALILGHSKNKNIKEALAVVDTMNAAGVRLSATSYAHLIAAYIEDSNLERATMLVQQHTGNFSAEQIVKLMRLLALNSSGGAVRQDLMELLIRQLPSEYLHAKEVPHLLRNVCTELIFKTRLDDAYFIIKTLPVPQFSENQDSDTYGVSFLQDLFRSRTDPKKIIGYAKDLIESGKNLRALHVACDSAMHRNPEFALPFLKTLSQSEPLKCHYFWPLILHKFRNDGEAGIFAALKTMSSLGVDCDFETLSAYVLPRLSVTLENPQNAIKTLESCGLKTSLILTPIIAQMIFQQNLDQVIKVAQLYTSRLDTRQFIHPLTNLAVGLRTTKRYEKFSIAVHTLYLKAEEPNRDFVGQVLLEIINHNKIRNDGPTLRRIITDLSRLRARVSPAAAEILSSHVGKLSKDENLEDVRKMLVMMVDRKLSLPMVENSGSQIIHPRDMTYDQLECHLVELEAKGMNTRGILRRLLQMCIREGKLERALEVKKKCEDAKVVMSPGMMASLFDLNIRLCDAAAAETCYKQILQTYPGFLLDEHKIIDFAALLVHQGKLDEARNLLSDRASSRKVFGGDYVLKNVWNLLTNVAQQAAKNEQLPIEQNLTKDFFFFLKKHGFCNSHNTVIGPIIREYIYRKDIRAAIDEFKRLAEAFRHTPLQFELMSILVGLSNSKDSLGLNVDENEAKTLLQQLTTTVAGIHGQINMNSSLLLAIAESGTENQLRKLLINPEFRVNHDMLQQNCEHLNEEGCIDTLLRLAKACRGLGHVLKEQDVYDMLLSKFVRDNNLQASLQLYEKLEADDDLKMSQEFLKKLVDLLKVNKMDIPSSLGLRAQIM